MSIAAFLSRSALFRLLNDDIGFELFLFTSYNERRSESVFLRSATMTKTAEELVSKLRSLSDAEKLMVLDAIMTDLDRPDPEIDHIWAVESRKRWAAYKDGRVSTISYEEVMEKYRRS